jgi:hypothetical protein
MTGTVLHFPESRIEAIRAEGGEALRVRFEPARVVKSEGIPLADASTLWTQSGDLVVDEAELEGAAPALPASLRGGSLEAGGLKTIDMARLPLDASGYVEVRLVFEDGAEVTLRGSGVRLEMEATPRYLRHLEG